MRSTSGEHSFAQEARDALRNAQSALSDLLASADVDGIKPIDISRRLGINKNLAWKAARFSRSTSPSTAIRYLPGTGGVEILLAACAQNGADDAVVIEVKRADRVLRECVSKHAGDLQTFESMLAAGQSGIQNERAALENRRSHFRSGSSMWGVRADLQFLTFALMPSRVRPGYLDVTQVSGFHGFERLRPDVPWTIRRLKANNDSNTDIYKVVREPLDDECRSLGLPPLFRDYCTQPLPKLHQVQSTTGWLYDELAPGEVGREGKTTVVLGECYRGLLPLEPSEDNRSGMYSLTVRTPVRNVVFDVLCHESLTQLGHPVAQVKGILEDRGPEREGAGSRFSRFILAPEPAVALSGADYLHTQWFHGYGKMFEDALSRSGFDDTSKFRGYRLQREFPEFPCELKFTVTL